jgi:hypothetical protein
VGDIFAVLMGDIVGSRRLSEEQLDQERTTLLLAANELKHWKRGFLVGTPEFFRGDAWQILLAKPEWSLRAAIFLRAWLLSSGLADTRVVIGMGTVDRINIDKITLSTGQAFTSSGHMLDDLSQFFRMSIAVPTENIELANWLPVVGHLCDMIVAQWTKRQAEIVRTILAPDNPTHAEVAKRLKPKITQQAVTKALAGAGWHGLRSALKQFEKTDWEKICCRDNL